MTPITPAQLGDWFDRHAAALVLYAQQWLDRAAAEDVVQQVFVRLGAQSRAPDNVRAWLLLSVRHAALDALRSAGRRRQRERHAAEAQAHLLQRRPDGNVDRSLNAADVQDALENLPALEREIVTLRIWAGATFDEIAGVLHMPVSTMHSRYRSALEMLRARWETPCRKT